MIALLAVSALSRVISKWAVLWLGDLRSIALAHFAEVIAVGSMLLASHISSRWLLSSGLMAMGTLKAIILNDLFRNSAFDPMTSHICLWLVIFESQVAASSLSASITVPPFLVLATERILPVVSPSPVIISFSSVLSWVESKWDSLEFLIPSIKNCLALIPSLAAILGFACAGGLTRAEAYVFAGGLVCAGMA